MSEAATTPVETGSDSVRPALSLDDAMEVDFYDPGEETVEVEEPEQSEGAPGEVEEDQEAEEVTALESDDDADEAGEPGEEDKASTLELGDDIAITVDGQKLTLGELKKGYFREADYTRHKQKVSQKESQLGELSARVDRTVEAVADYLVKQIPAAPDPQLAMTNPAQFVQQKAMHEAASAQLTALLEQAGEVKEVVKELTAEQRRELIADEKAKLAAVFPTTTTDEGRQKFFTTAATAAKDLGYSDEEIRAVMDHRMFALAHYAAIGMRAEKSREKAKEKVQNAPPVAPQKQRVQNAQGNAARRNKEAMKRLARTGSIEDAMAIDFD